MTDKEKAIAILKNQLEILSLPTVHQTQLNIASDYLRKYLGEQSKIYYSLSLIDISINDGKFPERISNAKRLIESGILFIQENDIDKDLENKILALQYKELKHKRIYGAIGFIIGSIVTFLITYAKEIYTLLTQGHL